PHGVGIERGEVAALHGVGLRLGEQPVVEPDLRRDRVLGAQPVDRALDLVLVRAGRARLRVRHDPRAHGDDAAVPVLLATRALDDVGVAKPHAVAWIEATEALGRDLLEVLALDPQLAGEGQRAFAAFG